ncbi:MAG: hypothetical protein D6814_14405 [Calditrichaeota bacterium]|nr:MAG: hypothetical protein D6814_14405 [Calditrichota bacterium]
MINSILRLVIGLLFMAGFYSQGHAQAVPRSTGIGARATFWNMNNTLNAIIIRQNPVSTQINVGSAGGWLSFLSRTGDYTFLEFSLGAVGRVENRNAHVYSEQVDVSAVFAATFGVRYRLFDPGSRSALQPYLAFGGGPYWLSAIAVRDNPLENEIFIRTKLKPGAYLGGGLDFFMTSWLALNFDVRYHFVDLNVKEAHSGYEYGLGMTFLWGRYPLKSRH